MSLSKILLVSFLGFVFLGCGKAAENSCQATRNLYAANSSLSMAVSNLIWIDGVAISPYGSNQSSINLTPGLHRLTRPERINRFDFETNESCSSTVVSNNGQVSLSEHSCMVVEAKIGQTLTIQLLNQYGYGDGYSSCETASVAPRSLYMRDIKITAADLEFPATHVGKVFVYNACVYGSATTCPRERLSVLKSNLAILEFQDSSGSTTHSINFNGPVSDQTFLFNPGIVTIGGTRYIQEI